MIKTARPLSSALLAPLGVAVVLALAGCSQQGTPAAAPSASAVAAANEADATKLLKLYQQTLASGSKVLAVPVGEELIRKYPDTQAAAEARKTLPGIRAAADAKAEHDRLANLWYYQTANVQGKQHTATIYADGHRRTDQVRLVLRRHVKWGQSAYLFGSDKGFVCKGDCDIVMHFDGKRETWTGYLPPTGEPAMFIKHDKRFIAALAKAKVIQMDVTRKGHGKTTLKFEVEGYDPARFLTLPKK